MEDWPTLRDVTALGWGRRGPFVQAHLPLTCASLDYELISSAAALSPLFPEQNGLREEMRKLFWNARGRGGNRRKEGDEGFFLLCDESVVVEVRRRKVW